ncbi:aminotransferase class V-fold PLP-dependent enzyme [Novosphingobium sp. AP12]|uniref:aminotransferase class V-fold PLP-dependent enzyme n=1 Tax=Novosphingobium sp. AP12 TaxID=1144305 RepID=UPI000271F1AD|nr:aminotransferase class V-fold PLP-dependent enzyme [Novosphingobium sp. AP12]EJL24220.1 selenocysteine lyase [Novosphingobium sp. AP12]
MTSRRNFLIAAGSATIAPAFLPGAAQAASTPAKVARFGGSFPELERQFAALYDVDRSVVNLDAAYYGAMTKPVKAAYTRHLDWMNRYNSTFLRNGVEGVSRDAVLGAPVAAVEKLIGAQAGEVAFSAGGTDALYALIANYRPLKAGDSVIYADVDYDEMQFAMDYLQANRGAKVVRFSLPVPSTRANILAAYEKVLNETPSAKLLLLTHVSNRNGLIPPVAEIIRMAKARGVDVILDSAQAVGQMPLDVNALGADFVGFSLHKWLAAPLGTGGIYIRKNRLQDISPWLGNRIYDADDIRARLPTGTANVAAQLTVTDAAELQGHIGLNRKFEHLKALRNRWVEPVRELPGLEMTLPDEPANYAAISSFRLPGMRTVEQTKKAQALFLAKYKLMIVAKAGLAGGAVLRVTPGLYNTGADLDRLVGAVRAEYKMFA